MDGRRWRRLIRIAAIVMLIAVLPSALYMGHWPFLPGFQESETVAEAHAHAGHCHDGPSNCSDGPAPTAPALPHPETLAVATLGLLLLMWVHPLGEATDAKGDRMLKPPRRTSPLSAA